MANLLLPSVAFVGLQGSGKSTLASLLVAQYGYIKHSWAAPVREIFSMAYEEIRPENYLEIKGKLYEVSNVDGTKSMLTGGELLQKIGTEALRDQVDQDFWIKAGVKRIWRNQVCNDDTRFINEAQALRSRGWVIVRVTAPADIRKQRIKGAYRNEGHISEVEQSKIAEDYTIVNDNATTIEAIMGELLTYLHSVPMSIGDIIERSTADGPI